MMMNPVIELSSYRAHSPEPFDYAGYNRRAVRRYRRAARCQLLVTALETLCALTFAVCLVIGTAAVLSMG